MINICHLKAIADKNSYEIMNEYSVPFLHDNHKVRMSWGLPNNGHEGNDKHLGQNIVLNRFKDQ